MFPECRGLPNESGCLLNYLSLECQPLVSLLPQCNGQYICGHREPQWVRLVIGLAT